MKIRIDEVPGKFFFVVEHDANNSSVIFDSPYYYDFLANPWANDFSYLFEPLNTFWASLSGESQSAIMTIYAELRTAIDNAVAEPHHLTDTIPALIAELHAYNSVDNIVRWINTVTYWRNLKVYTPLDCGQVLYDPEEYKQLIALIISMKAVMPIWHAYQIKAQEAVGLVLPEANAYRRIMAGSSVKKSPAMEKLKAFVQIHLDKCPSRDDAGFFSVGEQDVLEVVTGALLMRRAVLMEASSEYTTDLLRDMHSYLNYILKISK
jgi:hypothetical protein